MASTSEEKAFLGFDVRSKDIAAKGNCEDDRAFSENLPDF
jgi:hypothetical protein